MPSVDAEVLYWCFRAYLSHLAFVALSTARDTRLKKVIAILADAALVVALAAQRTHQLVVAEACVTVFIGAASRLADEVTYLACLAVVVGETQAPSLTLSCLKVATQDLTAAACVAPFLAGPDDFVVLERTVVSWLALVVAATPLNAVSCSDVADLSKGAEAVIPATETAALSVAETLCGAVYLRVARSVFAHSCLVVAALALCASSHSATCFAVRGFIVAETVFGTSVVLAAACQTLAILTDF